MVKPTTMLYRNFLAMETEELLRSHPVDGAVLMGGCDKTTPGLLMGASRWASRASTCRPARCCAATGAATTLGSGSDAFKYWDERRAGRLSDEAWSEMEGGIARSHGTCMTMGTAATMMGIAEAIGMTLARRELDPRGRCQPHPHERRVRPAHRADGVGRPARRRRC